MSAKEEAENISCDLGLPVESWGCLNCPRCPREHGKVAGKPIVGGPGIFLTLWGMVGMRCDAPLCFHGQTLVVISFTVVPMGGPTSLL